MTHRRAHHGDMGIPGSPRFEELDEDVFPGMVKKQRSGLGRSFIIQQGNTDILVLSWKEPHGEERDVELQLTPNWNASGPLLVGPTTNAVNTPTALGSPSAAGRTVVARWRWSTGSMTRDTVQDLTDQTGTAPVFSSQAMSARGLLASMRASQVDVFLSNIVAGNTPLINCSLSGAVSRTSKRNPFIGYAGALNSAVNTPLQRLPTFSQEIRIAGPDPTVMVQFAAPDAITVVEQGILANYKDWKPLHSAAVFYIFASGVASDADNVRAEFR